MKTIISNVPSPHKSLKNRRKFRLGAIEMGYPWLTLGAIIELENLVVTLDFNVLELGSGGSTVFFSKRCGHVKSYEHDASWAEKVKGKLPETSNVMLFCGNIDEIMDSLCKEPENHYDLLLVDSGIEKLRMMIAGSTKVKRGGFMVVDNYITSDIRGFNYSGWKVRTYDQFRYAGRGTLICIRR